MTSLWCWNNFLTLFKVILLPQRCHENLEKILNIVDMYRKSIFYIHWEYGGWKTRIPSWGRRVLPNFNRVRKPSVVCVCVHIWQLESFIISGKMTGQCIQQHIHNLACILHIFMQHSIGGRGRYLNLFIVEGELETLWEESLTISTCHDCLANIVILMDIVIRAYRVPRPQFHFNVIYVYIMSFLCIHYEFLFKYCVRVYIYIYITKH